MIRKRENYSLAGRNTFRMNVGCACWVEYDSPADLEELDLEALPQPVMHIGAGSNLLFTGDFPGTVLHSNVKYYKVVADAEREVLLEVGAGVVFDDFCAWASDNELWGAENLSGIPGEVGAAAVQNIGAYGAEVKDIIAQVKCYDLERRRIETLPVARCGYGYRDSAFKHAPLKGRFIVMSVLFRLSKEPQPRLEYGPLKTAFAAGAPAHPAEVRQLVLRIRDSKLPDPAVLGSAGSFFKNPVVSAETYERVVAAVNGCGEGAGLGEQKLHPSGNAPLKPAPTPQLGAPVATLANASPKGRLQARAGREERCDDREAPAGKRSGGRNPLGVQGDSKKGTTPVVPHFEVGPGQIKIPAAWLIDQCGLKGLKLGEAAVYDKQPLVIVNATGTACPEDILALEQTVIDRVRQKFGIELHPEVEHISAAPAAQQPKI